MNRELKLNISIMKSKRWYNLFDVKLNGTRVGTLFQDRGQWRHSPDSKGYDTRIEAAFASITDFLNNQAEKVKSAS